MKNYIIQLLNIDNLQKFKIEICYKTKIMKFISHRGNLDGPMKEFENHPDYINDAIKKGFDVEIDVRVKKMKAFILDTTFRHTK